MLGLKVLIESCQQAQASHPDGRGHDRQGGKPRDGGVDSYPIDAGRECQSWITETGVIMVDSQPHTGRRLSEAAAPHVVIDHHETGGDLNGVLFHDIRTHMGATSTMVTGYLMEQRVLVTPELATALLYGIESETSGYPREASTLDDGALVWLFPRADKDLLARIQNPKLPQSHFATFQNALVQCVLVPRPGFQLVWRGVATRYHRRDRRFFHSIRPGELVACSGCFRGCFETLAPGRDTGRTGRRSSAGGRQRAGLRRRPRQARRGTDTTRGWGIREESIRFCGRFGIGCLISCISTSNREDDF